MEMQEEMPYKGSPLEQMDKLKSRIRQLEQTLRDLMGAANTYIACGDQMAREKLYELANTPLPPLT